MYEYFDHTADMGIRVTAPNLNNLFAEAAEALFGAIVDDTATIRPAERRDFAVAGQQRDDLLFDWLRMLIQEFEVERRLYSRFDVTVGLDGLTASAWGEALDIERHSLAHEVKAVTYHQLKVEQTRDGWLAEVIVDI
jgi:SHS2 domain-containing protein